MRRNSLLILSLMLAAAGPLSAGTFTKAPIVPDQGLEALTRDVSRDRLGRDLFANPYATVTISHVDVYDRFPYVETRHFQIVSDPRWNRLIYGERGGSLKAYDGASTSLGALSRPRGLAVDERDRVYVADAGRGRILVLQATTELGDITLAPVAAIDGLSDPHDVAVSDGGTPFSPADDRLYVAETGRNRIVAYALEASGARRIATLGDLGSGAGRFAGPMAIAVGRDARGSTRDLYVADAHNRRIVRLRDDGASLRWMSETSSGGVLTSLDTDAWGNVYAAAPGEGVVRKLSPELAPVAELRGERPRGFYLPFAVLRDHRDGRVARIGQPSGVSVDQWDGAQGIRLWNLGLELADVGVSSAPDPAARFTLTDQARIALEVRSGSDGRVLGRRDLGTLPAGSHVVPLRAADLGDAAGDTPLVLRLDAASSYADGPTETVQASFRLDGGAVVSAARPMLVGNAPNPAAPETRITFVLPAGHSGSATLRLFDAQGRRVRGFDRSFSPGLNDVVWDGTGDDGHPVRAGVYFYRLDVGELHFTRRLVLVR